MVLLRKGGVTVPGMRELADHILAVANEQELQVTNLQIQKVMFFAIGMHIRRTGRIDQLVKETYDIPFDKWRYGPVVESIYYRLNIFKDREITLPGTYYAKYSDWDVTITRLLQINVFDLVKLSHKLPSWANYENDILQRNYVNSYTLEEIAEDFLE